MSDRAPDVSPVASPTRLSARGRNIAYGVAGITAIGLLGLGVNTMIHDAGPPQKAADTGSSVIAQVTQTPPPPADPSPPAKPAEVKEIVYVNTSTPAAAAVVSGGINYVLMPSGSGETSFDVPAAAQHEDKPAATAAASAAARDAASTQVAFKPAVIAGGKAGPAMRLTYMMMPGIYPCALDVAMDSTIAGAISCHTTQDILSPDRVLLMGAGTKITGTYKNDVKQGQSRLFAFAGYAITQEGIPVPLDAGVADGLGRSGIPGVVDPHFWPRFGAGILIAGSQSALSLAQAYVSKGGDSYFNLNAGGGGTDVATEILRQQEQQAPTVSVSPGTIISIVVDHPIDFSDVLKIRTRE